MIGIGGKLLIGYLSFVAFTVEGIGLPVDTEESSVTRKTAEIRAKAERGFVKQEVELADVYFAGDGVPRDVSEAARWYEKAAADGDPVAQNQIGYFYQAGIGVPRDPVRAAHWYQLASASGLGEATVNLGILYLKGLGVPQNAQTAQQLFGDALRRGCGTGGAYLGDMYYFGIGIPKDETTAERWYQAGVKAHDPVSEYRLGSLYSFVDGHMHDFRKASILFRASSEKGFVLSMHFLGLLLASHPELAKSPNEGVPLLEAAANAGNWRSSVVLGILARDGKGVPSSLGEAYLHFQIAAQQGGPEAQRYLAHDLKVLGAKLDAGVLQELNAKAEATAAQHSLVLLYVDKGSGHRPHLPAISIAQAPSETAAGLLIPAAAN